MRGFFVAMGMGWIASSALAGVVLQDWEMNDPAGTTLSQTINREGKAHWSAKYDIGCVRTDGKGNLRIVRSSKPWHGVDVGIGNLPSGEYALEYRISSMDFSGAPEIYRYYSFGIQFRSDVVMQLQVVAEGMRLNLHALFRGECVDLGRVSDSLASSNLTLRIAFAIRDGDVLLGAGAFGEDGKTLARSEDRLIKGVSGIDTLRMEFQTAGFYENAYVAVDRIRLIRSAFIAEVDADGDGLSDAEEERAGTDSSLADTDGDGLLDGEEVNALHTDPLEADTDGDGLLDGEEANTLHTDPLKPDTDGDGLSDYTEIFSSSTNPRSVDTDSDGLSDKEEVDSGKTDPNDADSDDDGIPDGKADATTNRRENTGR